MREAPSESLEFSPNQLVFGHRVRDPLEVFWNAWCRSGSALPESLLGIRTRERLLRTLKVAESHLGQVQRNMNAHYDRKTKYRSFAPGDEVLMLLPV